MNDEQRQLHLLNLLPKMTTEEIEEVTKLYKDIYSRSRNHNLLQVISALHQESSKREAIDYGKRKRRGA